MFLSNFLFPCQFRAPRPSYSITINVAARRLTLYKDGKVFKSYVVAVGKPSTPTPKGNFTIINKAVNPGGPFGARWLGLSARGYGIHGTNNPSSIGKAVSNGCIRLLNANVIELFNLVSIGTPVKII
ncbi:L,D-transpeptidase [Clostridium sp. CX1]|uniref:L,D-transpeptidase n=1 Tax=Clostridium sp. CX1 TaxID=2978346 RepID=UPI0021C23546|nr:L,D-transpeptidase [Clostridium sp. CX1]MCT8975049.1 L,D-transpeptidase [Clostridium sp. CX1]